MKDFKNLMSKIFNNNLHGLKSEIYDIIVFVDTEDIKDF